MAKIRDDFDGVVYAEGLVLKAGDKIPAGVRVGGHLTDTGEDVGTVVEPVPDATEDPLNDADAALAAELGIDGSPDWVRGYLACAADLAGEPETPASDEFDPSTVNAPEVHEYLKEHPEATARVIELERAGRNRKGIVDAYPSA